MMDFTANIYGGAAMTDLGIKNDFAQLCEDALYLIGSKGEYIKFCGTSGYTKEGEVYLIEYTDGRFHMVSEYDYVLNGGNIVPVKDIASMESFHSERFYQPQIEFDRIKIPSIIAYGIDYYAIGYILGGSNFDKPYVEIAGIPMTYKTMNNYIRAGYSMHNLTQAYTSSGYVDQDKLITWCDLIGRKTISTGIIIEHLTTMVKHASIRDRSKFILGCLDVQRDINNPTWINQFTSHYEAIINAVRWIMLSLGINCIRDVDNLYPVGNRQIDPNLSYNVDTIEAMLHKNRFLYDEQWILAMKSIKRVGRGVVWNLARADGTPFVYLDQNLLPRVSASVVYDINGIR